jgi:hypothetical protein
VNTLKRWLLMGIAGPVLLMSGCAVEFRDAAVSGVASGVTEAVNALFVSFVPWI